MLLLLLVQFLQNLAVCSAGQRAMFLQKSIDNVQALQKLHEGVFLGECRTLLCAVNGVHNCCIIAQTLALLQTMTTVLAMSHVTLP